MKFISYWLLLGQLPTLCCTGHACTKRSERSARSLYRSRCTKLRWTFSGSFVNKSKFFLKKWLYGKKSSDETGCEKGQGVMTGWSGTSALLKPRDKSDFQYFSSYCHFQWWTQMLILDLWSTKQNVGKYLVFLWCKECSFWPLRPMFWYEKESFSSSLMLCTKTLKHSSLPLPHPIATNHTAICVCAQTLQ